MHEVKCGIYDDTGEVCYSSTSYGPCPECSERKSLQTLPVAQPTLSDEQHGEWVDCPDAQGWWWHWDENPEHVPFMYSLLTSLSRKINREFIAYPDSRWCIDVGGKWMKATVPTLPGSKLPSPSAGSTGEHEMKEFLSVCEEECNHPYCWSQKASAGSKAVDDPTDDYLRGFNRCRDLAMNIVDEHEGFLDRIEHLNAITTRLPSKPSSMPRWTCEWCGNVSYSYDDYASHSETAHPMNIDEDLNR